MNAQNEAWLKMMIRSIKDDVEEEFEEHEHYEAVVTMLAQLRLAIMHSGEIVEDKLFQTLDDLFAPEETLDAASVVDPD